MNPVNAQIARVLADTKEVFPMEPIFQTSPAEYLERMNGCVPLVPMPEKSAEDEERRLGYAIDRIERAAHYLNKALYSLNRSTPEWETGLSYVDEARLILERAQR